MSLHICALLSFVVCGSGMTLSLPEEASSKVQAKSKDIEKVVTLLEEMKAQVEREVKQDEGSFDKFKCWCTTNEEAKTEAISTADARIEDLTSFLESSAAKAGRLKTEIAGLEQDISDDQDSLATATALREKEKAAFEAEEEDLKETLALLSEAVGVLSKVQLLQKGGKQTVAEEQHAHTVLLQVRNKIQQKPSRFQNVMQRDLFDMLGSLQGYPQMRGASETAFMPKRATALVEQKGQLLPWEKYDEQIGAEAKPNELVGAAANSKSYNSRSGKVVGLLREMGDETARDLADAQKADYSAEVAYQNLRAAKISEIRVATKQKTSKAADLADTMNDAAKARKDRAATTEAMDADQTFLGNMQNDCDVEEEQYKQRVAVRSQELVALAETLKILTEDDARGLFANRLSLVQISKSSTNATLATRAALQDRAVKQAMQKIAAVAKKHNNWALVSLAVRSRLDAFTKVKEAMDKMLAELAKQQKEEYAKWEACKADIDKTEDSIKVGEQTKEDLDKKHAMLVNSLARLDSEIKALKAEEEEMKVSLKQAGELRKEENQVFQVSITDQRATSNILSKALDRLKQFYTAGLVQVQVGQPGRAVAPRPDEPKDYSKSGAAGGVIQLLMKVIANSAVAEKEFEMDEQRSQQLYADFVKASSATIEAARAAIAERSIAVSELKGHKAETEGSQLANDDSLAKLGELLHAYHLDCDYLLKNFNARQQARQEEMDAITDAKAVLSGADFAAK